ncbi:MAG: hypothetical protein J0L62_11510 [Bacteroidetes bacterium]|nr:hypothetical protein [Bacteroidota bacterium]
MILSLLSSLSIFGFGQSKSPYKVEQVFTDLREMAFSVSPQDLQLQIEDKKIVFAVFMETGYPEAAFSLRCLGEGTISIYFTNGGGFIGIGEHALARKAGMKLIEMSNSFLTKARLTKTYELPKVGYTKFYFRTNSGVFTFEEKEETLGNGKSEFSELFYQAQEVITLVRQIEEEKKIIEK